MPTTKMPEGFVYKTTEARRNANKKWRDANKAQISEIMRKHHETNKERINAQRRQKYAEKAAAKAAEKAAAKAAE